MINQSLRAQRKALVEAEYNSYDPEAFPGSPQWRKNKAARNALDEFDAAHPEVAAEIKAEAAAKKAAAVAAEAAKSPQEKARDAEKIWNL